MLLTLALVLPGALSKAVSPFSYVDTQATWTEGDHAKLHGVLEVECKGVDPGDDEDLADVEDQLTHCSEVENKIYYNHCVTDYYNSLNLDEQGSFCQGLNKLKMMSSSERPCKDNHATCTEGDSLLRLQDLLLEECQGVEPAQDEEAAMAFTLSQLKGCQENLEVRDCAKELCSNMSSDAAQHDLFCQGLKELKSLGKIVLRQMCPGLDIEDLMPPTSIRQGHQEEEDLDMNGDPSDMNGDPSDMNGDWS